MRSRSISLILALFALTGCVASESPATLNALDQLAQSQAKLADALDRQKPPAVNVAPIDWKPLLEQLRAGTPAAEDPGLYTGALVHLDGRAGRCPPCDRLKHDLTRLARETEWTVGPHGPVHWRLILHERPDFPVPRIDFVQDGCIVRSLAGYGDTPSKPGYQGPLHTLINQHPSAETNR